MNLKFYKNGYVISVLSVLLDTHINTTLNLFTWHELLGKCAKFPYLSISNWSLHGILCKVYKLIDGRESHLLGLYFPPCVCISQYNMWMRPSIIVLTTGGSE